MPPAPSLPAQRNASGRLRVVCGCVLALSLLAGPAVAADLPVAPAAEALSLPFAHHVGERWGLRFEREERRGALAGPTRVSEAQAHVRSLYGRDLLVELTWRRVVEGTRVVELEPRRADNAEALDLLGGGRWLLRVDVRGTALAFLNACEVRTALARARKATLDDEAWLGAEAELLEGWNVAYGACGVPLVPSAERVTPLLAGDVEAGRDVRTLVLEHAAAALPGSARTPRVTALSVEARTHLRLAGKQGVSLERTSSTRYDLASGRLSGWRMSVTRSPEHGATAQSAGEREVEPFIERLAFTELAALDPAASAPLAAR